MDLVYLMAKIKEELISANIPLEIGCDVQPCPYCGRAMSFAYNHYFCRICGYNQNGNEVNEKDCCATNYEREG
jgi:hypothetical protein